MSHLITSETVQPGDAIREGAHVYTIESVRRVLLTNYGYQSNAIVKTSEGPKTMWAGAIYHRA